MKQKKATPASAGGRLKEKKVIPEAALIPQPSSAVVSISAGGEAAVGVIDDRADELTCTEIVSRYQVPHEYVLLTKTVNALHPQLSRQVVAVICDTSQLTHTASGSTSGIRSRLRGLHS